MAIAMQIRRNRSCAAPERVLTVGLAFAALAAAGVRARAQDALPNALTLDFAEGIHACVTSDEIATQVSARVGEAVFTNADGDAPLSIAVHVAPSFGTSLQVTIETLEHETGVTGRRELHVEGNCDALASPLSLVLALMIAPPASGSSAPAAITPPPAAITPPPAATAHATSTTATVALPAAASPPAPQVQTTPAATNRTRDTAPITARARARSPYEPVRFALSAGAGMDLGMIVQSTPLLGAAARMQFPGGPVFGEVRLAAELGAEYLFAVELQRLGWKYSIGAAGIHGVMCGVLPVGRFGIEPCAGLWGRALRLQAEALPNPVVQVTEERVELPRSNDDAVMIGWSAKIALRMQIAGPFSAFAQLQVLGPFARRTLELHPRVAGTSPGSPSPEPFHNSGQASVVTELSPDGPVDVLEHPLVAAVPMVGVTLAP
jgi:hypothetical protein